MTHEKIWTMRVSDSNRTFLQTLCKKDESFDSAISKLILNYSKIAKAAKQQVKELTA